VLVLVLVLVPRSMEAEMLWQRRSMMIYDDACLPMTSRAKKAWYFFVCM
jgi:hypothetical protein